MLVVGQTAHDGRRADIRQAEPVAEQRQQHLRIEEAAAVEQRKDEIRIGRVEQCGIAVGDRQGDPQPLQYLPHLAVIRSEEHTSELQSLMRISYAVFCLKKKQTI